MEELEPDVAAAGARGSRPVRTISNAGKVKCAPRVSAAGASGSRFSPADPPVEETSDTETDESMGEQGGDESEAESGAESHGKRPGAKPTPEMEDVNMGGGMKQHPTAMTKAHAVAVSKCIVEWMHGCRFEPLGGAPWPIPGNISDFLRHDDVPCKFMWRHYIEIDPIMFECLKELTKFLINASNEATDARQEAHDWVMRHLEFHFTDEYGMLIYAEICMAEELSVMAEKVGKHVLLAMHSALYALIVAFEWFNVDYTAVRTFASSIDEGKGATAQFYDQSTPVTTATPASSSMQAAHAMLAELDKLGLLDLAAATPIVRLTPLSGALEGTTLSDTLEVRRSTRIHTVRMNRRLLSS